MQRSARRTFLIFEVETTTSPTSDSIAYLGCQKLLFFGVVTIWMLSLSTVTEPKTTILGNHDMFIEAGSTINLTCIIQADSMREGGHIYWNYDGKVCQQFSHTPHS